MDRFRAFLIHHPSPVHFGAFRVMAIFAMHLVASRGILLRRLGRRRPDGTHDKWQGQKRRQKHREKKCLPHSYLALPRHNGRKHIRGGNQQCIDHSPSPLPCFLSDERWPSRPIITSRTSFLTTAFPSTNDDAFSNQVRPMQRPSVPT